MTGPQTQTASAVVAAVEVVQAHRFRLVANDPMRARSGFTRYCVACHELWPCEDRAEAVATIRLADRLLEEARG